MIIHKDSHLDHGLSQAVVDFVVGSLSNVTEFMIATVELPRELGVVTCKLHGPAVGEPPVDDGEAFWQPRPGRQYPSRMCRRDDALTRRVTVIAGPHDGQPCVVYTIFGGPCSPKELGDPELKPEEREAAQKFWAEHALGV